MKITFSGKVLRDDKIITIETEEKKEKRVPTTLTVSQRQFFSLVVQRELVLPST